jgi:hypothetical protein
MRSQLLIRAAIQFSCAAFFFVAASKVASQTLSTAVCATVPISPETGLSGCDLIDGKAIIDPVVIANFAMVFARVSESQRIADSRRFPVAINAYFSSFVQLPPADPILPLLRTQIDSKASVNYVQGRFQSLTAARIFPCVFQTEDFRLESGDCDLIDGATPDYPKPIFEGLVCRTVPTRIPVVEQCQRR